MNWLHKRSVIFKILLLILGIPFLVLASVMIKSGMKKHNNTDFLRVPAEVIRVGECKRVSGRRRLINIYSQPYAVKYLYKTDRNVVEKTYSTTTNSCGEFRKGEWVELVFSAVESEPTVVKPGGPPPSSIPNFITAALLLVIGLVSPLALYSLVRGATDRVPAQ